MKHVLAIVGDFYHDAELAKESFDRVVEPFIKDGRLQVVYTSVEQIEQNLVNSLASLPDLVVLFAEDRIDPQAAQVKQWMTAEAAEAIESYVAGGGAWLAWHSGLASYPEDGAYVRMLGGHFLSHPAEHSRVTYTPLPGTELGELGGAFAFMDEHYFVACDEANTTIFMRSSSTDGESTAGWYHMYGSGRVGCLTPAHLSEGLLMPQFIEVMRSLVAWCTNMIL
ncbi:ThuA domain-containing protein [Paenibacillus sp. D2_2]|uniref:ThuA domain-containing protein n=1 Tax=Paenibacillus sp. D2_2 TaxID=3073092 RepID=UPI0028168FED|nr:ThuA domain-containing protein [Paenibacillus sp. D2_2]WMT41715.1 ThuA domain-containing protein [Paenibacillus sp. D2_2]